MRTLLLRFSTRQSAYLFALGRRRSAPSGGNFSRSYSKDKLMGEYERAKIWLQSKKLPADVDKCGVFANDELSLRDIQVYGFDYDYTLTNYRSTVETFIHNRARDHLVGDFKYPFEILKFEYDPSFCIRGLHYDIEKGLLLKVDSFHQIQLGTVYRGYKQLTNEEVLKLYHRRHIPLSYIEAQISGRRAKMLQLADIFAKPLMCLISSVIQWFDESNVEYLPQSVYYDIDRCIGRAHDEFHSRVPTNPGDFLKKRPELTSFLERLKENDKKIFLITNSPYETVDSGMKFMIGDGWRSLFDVTVVRARKPTFFKERSSYFREYNSEKKTLLFGRISKLLPHKIYSGGNIFSLQKLTGYSGNRVLYFGDHPYADLADLTLHHGWRTGAIIEELEDEIEIMNSEKAKWGLNWTTVLQQLLELNQDYETPECTKVLHSWREELSVQRKSLKEMCNPRFGSIFRTHQNPTSFSRRLFRFADIYTSKVTNLSRFSINHTFYPRRGGLPHEFRHWSD